MGLSTLAKRLGEPTDVTNARREDVRHGHTQHQVAAVAGTRDRPVDGGNTGSQKPAVVLKPLVAGDV